MLARARIERDRMMVTLQEHDLIVRNSYYGPYISQFLGEIQGVLVIRGLLGELKNL